MIIRKSFFKLELNCHLRIKRSWWYFSRGTLMYSLGMLTKLQGWIQASYAIIWMSIHLSPLGSNHLDVHLRNTLTLSRTRWWNLSRLGLLKRFFYLEWLANTVVVKKKTGKWCVCVDFTDLNKACPKDPFPMPRIDHLVDATVGHHRMSFLDAFQRYHQIPLALDD